MAVIGLLFTVGHLGEPLHPEASDPPVDFLVVWRVLGVTLALAMSALSLIELTSRMRRG
jgi:hypothetical protein